MRLGKSKKPIWPQKSADIRRYRDNTRRVCDDVLRIPYDELERTTAAALRVLGFDGERALVCSPSRRPSRPFT